MTSVQWPVTYVPQGTRSVTTNLALFTVSQIQEDILLINFLKFQREPTAPDRSWSLVKSFSSWGWSLHLSATSRSIWIKTNNRAKLIIPGDQPELSIFFGRWDWTTDSWNLSWSSKHLIAWSTHVWALKSINLLISLSLCAILLVRPCPCVVCLQWPWKPYFQRWPIWYHWIGPFKTRLSLTENLPIIVKHSWQEENKVNKSQSRGI